MKNYFFTSESVSEGHPDKVADQISDAVLDAYLIGDAKSRVACETMVSTGFVMLAGEVTSNATVDLPQVVRNTVKDIGYDDGDKGFDYKSCSIFISLDKQSGDIAQGVDAASGKEQGAGDQGIMFGYAINETKEFMPLTLTLAHELTRTLSQLRKTGAVKWLRPDAKSQVTLEYRDGKPVRVDSVVLSTQHAPEISHAEIHSTIKTELISKVIPQELIDKDTKYFINPTGRFVTGGPHGDCGLTGRKIIVDTYGGHGAHGGGAFSGKDPSKVDRSACYAARHVAKNIVAAGLADRCLVQLAYAIGVAEPMSVYVDTYGTSKVSEEKMSAAIKELWGLKPAQIVSYYQLLRPIYQKTASYGHFGRSGEEFTWERTEKVADLKSYFKM